MAAGSSVMELCTLADAKLDAATSAKFFRDDDGAGGAISSFSWPEAGRTSSRLFDQSALQALCEKYKVPAEYTPVCLDGRWMACQQPPEHTIFVYADALEAGMRIPLHDFYVETAANAQHAAEVRRLADESSTQLIEDLKKQQAAAVARLKEEQATSVDGLREEHAADVARVKDAADKEVHDTKKKIVLRLFPKLDVSLLERPKLKGDPSAAGTGTGTPKAEG